MRTDLESKCKKKSKFKKLFSKTKKFKDTKMTSLKINQDDNFLSVVAPSTVKHKSNKFQEAKAGTGATDNVSDGEPKTNFTFKQKLGFGKSKQRSNSAIKLKEEK
jgi:hypothetical protein